MQETQSISVNYETSEKYAEELPEEEQDAAMAMWELQDE